MTILCWLSRVALPMIAAASQEPLVDVRSVVPDVVLDVRYASRANFMARALYPFPAAHLRRSTAEKLERAALRRAMEAAGFKALEEEWWHYHDPDAKRWPLLDIPFEELAR